MNIRWHCGQMSRALLGAMIACICVSALRADPVRLSKKSEYTRYVDALIAVQDYGTHYYEDGAADASVVYPANTEPPYGYREPVPAVVDLIRLGVYGLPLLIDCLSDARLTKMRFDGNTITQAMNVPVGYVCLDILMSEVRQRPVWESRCDGDGLGVCINYGFYFRPDDYWECRSQQCEPRPWVLVVQRTWKKAYLAHRLSVHNPYDDFPVEEYAHLRTKKK